MGTLLKNDVSRFFCQIFVFVPCIFCYNLDKDFPIIYEGYSDDYFGFSVGLLQNAAGYKALVTAPRANSSVVTSVHQPGVLYKCDIIVSGNSTRCEEVVVDNKGNKNHRAADDRFSYTNKLDDMWLGVSLDIQRGVQEDKNVVVCGHLWKNQRSGIQYFANGVCYVIDGELNNNTVTKLVPFVNSGKQVIVVGGTNKSFFAFAQAGTSVTFSEDGNYLLLGSPGFYEGTGTIASYSLDGTSGVSGLNNPVIPVVNKDHKRTFSGYIGYSIAAGRFFGENVTYSAVGAPRAGNNHGMVYIFEPVSANSSQLIVKELKQGVQFGEYFGSAVGTVDLNNDGLTDLLVGAPFYSEEAGGDEGKVYVFVSNGKELLSFAELTGAGKADARFGTSIGDIGDLNQDSFNDVAVGAPYEGRGAVYIYHGTSEGLKKDYAQRIGAEEINPLISGFGISISRGLDIDDNFYPDLLIGSYSSSNAVLLRTHPVVQVSAELQFDPPKIDRNITGCNYNGEQLVCFKVTYCLSYSGKHAPPSLEFKTELQIDSEKQRKNEPVRGFLLSNDEQRTSVLRNMTLDAGSDRACFHEMAYIHGNIKDEIKPVQFFLRTDLDYEAMAVERNTMFCKNCPIIDPHSSQNVNKSVHFVVDCGSDNICSSDLTIEARVLENTDPKPVIIIGQHNTLTLDVTIRNRGETAYAPVLSVSLPPEVSIVKKDICDIQNDDQEEFTNTTLQCELGNSIKMHKAVNIRIKVDVKRIPLNTSSLNVYFEVGTFSTEVNDVDNELNLTIFFKAESDIGISGLTDDELIRYTEDKISASFVHTYYVSNYGPSPVDEIDIYLYIPVAVDGRNGLVDFLSVTNLEVDRSEMAVVPRNCSGSSIKYDLNNNTKRSKRSAFDQNDEAKTEKSENSSFSNLRGMDKRSVGGSASASSSGRRGDHVLNCQTVECEEIHCVAGPFPNPQKYTKLVLSAELDLAILNSAIDSWNRIELTTKGKISMRGPKANPEKFPDETTVETVLVKPGPLPPREVEKWIIIVSVIVGIILLIIILFALIKIGFFKRQKREKMRDMMHHGDLRGRNSFLMSLEKEEPAEAKPLNKEDEKNNDT